MNDATQIPPRNVGAQTQNTTASNAPISIIRFQTIAPAQLRAARSLLDWSRKELAAMSGVSPETIKNIEHGTFTPQDSTLKSLFETFARHGVEFFGVSALNLVGVVLVIPKEPAKIDGGSHEL